VTRRNVVIELPSALVDMFRGTGDLPHVLGEALRLGLTDEARPPEARTVEVQVPALRKQQAVTNLLHFFGRYWYLSATVARLQREVRRLELELEAIDEPDPQIEPLAHPQQEPPPLIQVGVSVDQSLLEEAARVFVSDSTSDPAATAIAFGAGLILLKRPLAMASTEEIFRDVGRYWGGVATLHYRAYVLGHDKQVLEFRLAARRAQIALQKRRTNGDE